MEQDDSQCAILFPNVTLASCRTPNMKATAYREFTLIVLTASAFFPRLGHCRIPFAEGEISFSNFSITPSAGTLQFQGDWLGAVFAQTGDAAQYNSGAGVPLTADAAGTYTSAHSELFAASGQPFNISGLSRIGISLGGQPADLELPVALTSFSGNFRVTGGVGPVDITCSVNVSSQFNEPLGQAAGIETVFTLDQDGNPILFSYQTDGMTPVDQTLSITLPVIYDTWYYDDVQLNTEPGPVPESSSTATLLLAALGTMALLGRTMWAQPTHTR
jgi:hypothetical protein